MKAGWEYKKLDDICTIVGRIGFRGYTKADLVDSPNDGAITLSPSNITNGELDFSKCTYISWDKYNESPEIMLTKGDVVLVKTASIGKCAVVKELPHKATLNPQFVVLKGIIGEPNFIGYYLKSPVAQITIKQMAGGVAIPTLSQKKLGTMLIPSPPLSEQQSIVDYLDSAFAKIDAMKANAEKALNEAKALFQASLKEMLEPKEGWETSTLKDECYKITDGTHQTPQYYPSGYIFLSSKNVTSRKIDWEDVKFIDESQHQLMYKRVAPQVGDILLAKNGTTGVAAMVDRDVVFDIYVSLALLRSRGNVTPEYLLAFVNSPIAKEQFDKRLIGMGVPNLHLGEINQVVITYPQDKVEQIRMTQRIEELDCLIIRLQENYDKISQECDALKQSILRQVFE